MGKRKQFHVYLTPELEEKLIELNSEYGTPFSKVITRALEQYFKAREETKANYAALLAEGRD